MNIKIKIPTKALFVILGTVLVVISIWTKDIEHKISFATVGLFCIGVATGLNQKK